MHNNIYASIFKSRRLSGDGDLGHRRRRSPAPAGVAWPSVPDEFVLVIHPMDGSDGCDCTRGLLQGMGGRRRRRLWCGTFGLEGGCTFVRVG
jgi:hypothetical protein